MPTVIAEGAMLASLENASEAVDITTPEGRTLGVFTPMKFPHSPYSREETERRRDEYRRTKEGSTTEEVLSRMPIIVENGKTYIFKHS